MRKVFTYSRKKPFSSLKTLPSDNSTSKENFDNALNNLVKRKYSFDSHSQLISSIISNSIDADGNTPQTKRRKEIQNLLAKVDCKLKFLDLNEKADFKKFYRHKNIILSEIRSDDEMASFDDLMQFLKQESVQQFNEWIESKLSNGGEVCKIGEATFSEVFKFEMGDGSRHVVKIIPLDLDNNSPIDQYPLPINMNAAIHECKILRKISTLQKFGGFTKVIEICVVKGLYPNSLANEWNNWKDSKGSENSDPGRYNDDQTFLLLTMEDGGVDLESFKFKNMRQIQSVIVQLVYALAMAEECIEFEHRDLHLGNILVKNTDKLMFTCGGPEFETVGLECCIIDYSLSRLRNGNEVVYRDLDSIEWLFEGDSSVDKQYQVYKDMRSAKTDLSWRDFNPKSNILWLSLILDKLLLKQKKSIQSPKFVFKNLTDLRKRIFEYNSVSELKNSDLFFKESK